jgi:putative transcriptional regulator
MSSKDLINHLKAYRRRRGDMTQQALAEAAGVSRQSIISIESGKYRPSVELALRLARALDAGVEDLFALADEREDAS